MGSIPNTLHWVSQKLLWQRVLGFTWQSHVKHLANIPLGSTHMSGYLTPFLFRVRLVYCDVIWLLYVDTFDDVHGCNTLQNVARNEWRVYLSKFRRCPGVNFIILLWAAFVPVDLCWCFWCKAYCVEQCFSTFFASRHPCSAKSMFGSTPRC